MWINKETGRKAWLVSQDGDVQFSTSADRSRPKTVPSHEFFMAHREATPEEIEEHEAEAKAAKKPAGEKSPA